MTKPKSESGTTAQVRAPTFAGPLSPHLPAEGERPHVDEKEEREHRRPPRRLPRAAEGLLEEDGEGEGPGPGEGREHGRGDEELGGGECRPLVEVEAEQHQGEERGYHGEGEDHAD